MEAATNQGQDIASRLYAAREQIEEVGRAHRRSPGAVQLLAVSKGHSAQAISQAYAAGQRHFGENYWQELKPKAANAPPGIVWHFIGQLQSRKARQMANRVDWIHSVTRAKTARLLSQHRSADLEPLNICIQVSVCGEEGKEGIAPAEIPALLDEMAGLERLAVRGLMTMLPIDVVGAGAQAAFGRLRDCREELCAKGYALETLSMGMSQDWREAIAAGSTFVRLGTAIFGPRPGTSPAPGQSEAPGA